jgi:hypothetical protein
MVEPNWLAASRTIVMRAGAMGTQTGVRADGRIKLTDAQAGVALYGGYRELSAGLYRALVWLSCGRPAGGSGRIDVCCQTGEQIISEAQFDASALSAVAPFIQIDFRLFRAAKDVEIRLHSEAGLTIDIESLEIIPLYKPRQMVEPRPSVIRPDGTRRPLNILYYSVHEILEYDEIRMLTDAGHRVFSMGNYRDPSKHGALRRPLPQFFYPGDWERYNSEGLTREFAEQFDVTIVMHEIEKAAQILNLCPDMPVVYRSIGQATMSTEAKLRLLSDRIKIVRYSIREAETPGFLPADAVIYFGKNLEDFSRPWVGGDRLITFHNNYILRRNVSVPSPEDYLTLSSTFPCKLYGLGNDGMAEWGGLTDPEKQLELYRSAALYLYVCTVGPNYTLSFMEAMGTGLPVVAPSARMIESTADAEVQKSVGFSGVSGRYEIEDLLDNDDALIYSSINEAKSKIEWLLKNPRYCQDVSLRQRQRFSSMFDDKKIIKQWEALLYGMIGA